MGCRAAYHVQPCLQESSETEESETEDALAWAAPLEGSPFATPSAMPPVCKQLPSTLALAGLMSW